MAFMIPKYWYGKMYFCCDDSLQHGELYPADEFSIDELTDKECLGGEVCAETGWWTRLSADGYMDATPWSGPYPTHDEARRYIFDTFEVEPEYGMAIDEWEDNEGKAYVFKNLCDPRADAAEEAWERYWAKKGLHPLPRLDWSIGDRQKKKKTEGDLVEDFFFPPLPKPKGGGLLGIPRSLMRRRRR